MDMVYGQPGQFTWRNVFNLFNGLSDLGTGPFLKGIAKGDTIKEDLFYYCTNVTNFGNIFVYNAYLSSLPENMFNRCYNGVQFGSAFFAANTLGAFYSGSLVTLPSGSGFFSSGSYSGFKVLRNMFNQCINIDTLYSASFDNTITSGSSMLAQNMFSYGERGANPMQGQAPAIWTIPPELIFGEDAFKDCTNLSNYDDIPAGFK
jgi:hypothetical protein